AGSIYRHTGPFLEAGGTQELLEEAREIDVPVGRPYTMDIVAEGDLIKVLVNGKKVAEARDAFDPIRQGSICLACRYGCEMKYRKLEIRELADRKAVQEQAHQKDNFVPLFNGKEVATHWTVTGPPD